jgi:hypothetical protein
MGRGRLRFCSHRVFNQTTDNGEHDAANACTGCGASTSAQDARQGASQYRCAAQTTYGACNRVEHGPHTGIFKQAAYITTDCTDDQINDELHDVSLK